MSPPLIDPRQRALRSMKSALARRSSDDNREAIRRLQQTAETLRPLERTTSGRDAAALIAGCAELATALRSIAADPADSAAMLPVLHGIADRTCERLGIGDGAPPAEEAED